MTYGNKQLSDWVGGLFVAILVDVIGLPIIKALVSTIWYKIKHALFVNCCENCCSDDSQEIYVYKGQVRSCNFDQIFMIDQILIYDQNFHLLPKFPFFTKISIFYQNFHFLAKFPFFTKIFIFDQCFH